MISIGTKSSQGTPFPCNHRLQGLLRTKGRKGYSKKISINKTRQKWFR